MIGIVIGGLLSDNVLISGSVGDKIYPYAIDEEVALPAIIYKVNKTTPDYSKSGNHYDTTEVEVVVFAEGYEECLTIGKNVRSTLDFYKGEYSGSNTNVVQTKLTTIYEGYDFTNDVHYQQFIYELKNTNN